MIFESSIYKIDIEKEVKKIKKIVSQKNTFCTDKESFEIEKFVFVTAFLIRKLIESGKISDELEKEVFKVQYVSVVDHDAIYDCFNKNDIENNYDLCSLKKCTGDKFNLKKLMGILIHTHIFYILEEKPASKRKIKIAFNSDWTKENLYVMDVLDYLKICKLVYNDNIVSAAYGLKKPQDKFRSILYKSRNHIKNSCL